MTDEVMIVSLDQPRRWEAELAGEGLPSHSWGYGRALLDSGIEPRLGIVRAAGWMWI
jgi:hypothetical protein